MIRNNKTQFSACVILHFTSKVKNIYFEQAEKMLSNLVLRLSCHSSFDSLLCALTQSSCS